MIIAHLITHTVIGLSEWCGAELKVGLQKVQTGSFPQKLAESNKNRHLS